MRNDQNIRILIRIFLRNRFKRPPETFFQMNRGFDFFFAVHCSEQLGQLCHVLIICKSTQNPAQSKRSERSRNYRHVVCFFKFSKAQFTQVRITVYGRTSSLVFRKDQFGSFMCSLKIARINGRKSNILQLLAKSLRHSFAFFGQRRVGCSLESS